MINRQVTARLNAKLLRVHSLIEWPNPDGFVDFLKDALAAMNDRVRSPFFGSILLVFAGANWQPLAYLLFGETLLLERFAYFDANSSVWSLVAVPIAGGFVLAIAFPWIRLLGALFASAPKRRLSSLESEEAMLKRIGLTRIKAKEQRALADLEEAEEQRKIAAAKRLEQAREISDVTGDELERDRADKSKERAQPITNKRFQGDIRDAILVGLSIADDGKGILKYVNADEGEHIADEFVFIGLVDDSWIRLRGDRRKRLLVEATIDELVKNGYVESKDTDNEGNPIVQMSLKGYEAAEFIKSKYPVNEIADEFASE